MVRTGRTGAHSLDYGLELADIGFVVEGHIEFGRLGVGVALGFRGSVSLIQSAAKARHHGVHTDPSLTEMLPILRSAEPKLHIFVPPEKELSGVLL